MRKVLVLEVWADEDIADSRECVEEVISEAMGHSSCCDGTVDIKVIKNIYEDEDSKEIYIRPSRLSPEELGDGLGKIMNKIENRLNGGTR